MSDQNKNKITENKKKKLPDFEAFPDSKKEENPCVLPNTKTNTPKKSTSVPKETVVNTPSGEVSTSQEASAKAKPTTDTKKVLPPETATSKKPSQKPTKLSAQKLFLWFLGFGAILVFFFYIALFWAVSSGNVSNPLFTSLNISADSVQRLLIGMTSLFFGILSLIFLLIALIVAFQGLMISQNKALKKAAFKKSGIYFLVFLLTVGLWVFLYWFISQLHTGQATTTKQSFIKTEPAIVLDLDAPVQVDFHIDEALYKSIDPKSIRQIRWDFNEDGEFDSFGENVTHRFLDRGINNGIHNVRAEILYYADAQGKEAIFKTSRDVIINNESVHALITATPEAGTYPLEVELSAEGSADPDGAIILYEWDLDGDGIFEISSKTEKPVKKVFETVGEHIVKLRVTGSNTSDYDVAEQKIEVKNPEGLLRAEINTEGVTSGYAPLRVIFDGSNSFIREGVIIRYEWFIDGSKEPLIGRKVKKVFREPGEHRVRLVIENDIGERHETVKIITVLEDLPTKVIISTTPGKGDNQDLLKGVVPFEVTFDASKSSIKNALEWQWDFQSDGITDEYAQAAKHIFRKPGIYTVTLNILDADNKKYTTTQRVLVSRSGIKARIQSNPDSGEVPLRIDFDGSGSDTDEGTIVDYIWEFPNKEPIHYGSKISYLFKQIGNFSIKLTVVTSTGKTATTQTIISARAPHVKSDFKFSPAVGNAPLEVTMNPVASTGIVREYLWDFGDGQVQKQLLANPIKHTYKKPGKYKLKLRLTDSNGVIAETEKIIEVKPPRK